MKFKNNFYKFVNKIEKSTFEFDTVKKCYINKANAIVDLQNSFGMRSL